MHGVQICIFPDSNILNTHSIKQTALRYNLKTTHLQERLEEIAQASVPSTQSNGLESGCNASMLRAR